MSATNREGGGSGNESGRVGSGTAWVGSSQIIGFRSQVGSRPWWVGSGRVRKIGPGNNFAQSSSVLVGFHILSSPSHKDLEGCRPPAILLLDLCLVLDTRQQCAWYLLSPTPNGLKNITLRINLLTGTAVVTLSIYLVDGTIIRPIAYESEINNPFMRKFKH